MVDIQHKLLARRDLLKSASHQTIVVVRSRILVGILQFAIRLYAVGAVDISTGDSIAIAPPLRDIGILRFGVHGVHGASEHSSCAITFLNLADGIDISIDMGESLADFVGLQGLLLGLGFALGIATKVVEIVLDIGGTNEQILFRHLG